MKRRAFIALGSNMGDCEQFLRDALGGLPDVVAVSSIYETDPVGGPVQDDFLNAVVELNTSLSAHELLAAAQKLEREADRKRIVVNGPRTLDVDILLVGDETLDSHDLTVPHPRMWERRFVLTPLQELAPELVNEPMLAETVGEARRYQPTGSWPVGTRMWSHGSTRAIWTSAASGGLGHNPPRAEHDETCCGAKAAERRAAVREGGWLALTQVHGSDVVVAQDPADVEKLRFSEADAAVTAAEGVTLAIATADCAPIALSSDEGVVGAVHAGWKGLEAGVLANAVSEMRSLGATEIFAALGPCIHAECYEFGADELKQFEQRWGSAVATETTDGKPAFDLPAAVVAECAAIGVELHQVGAECTACSGEYFSYRTTGTVDRQVMLTWTKK